MIPVTIITLALIFFLPGNALAWGPATHLEVGTALLSNTGALAPGIASLISEFRYDFLYGNISADIVVGKNLVQELKHCHNWRFGFKLLKRASSDSERAFACGYLSHLASDTVAHNRFIPEMIIKSFSSNIHRHIYWELRFDALADKSVWRIPPKIEKNVHAENDKLLSSLLEDTPLSFKTNKKIFSSIINLHRIKQWHRMLDLLSKKSRWSLGRETRDHYFNQSLKAAVQILSNLEDAECTGLDPTGKKNLKYANAARKKLRVIQRSGRDPDAEVEAALKRLTNP